MLVKGDGGGGTTVIRAVSDEAAIELEDSLLQAVSVLRGVLNGGHVTRGAGVPEVAAAVAVERSISSFGGSEADATRAFARALLLTLTLTLTLIGGGCYTCLC